MIVEKISKKTFFKGRIFLLRAILLWVILLAFVSVLVNTFNARRYDLIDSFLPCVFLLFLWILFVLTIKGYLYWPAVLIVSSLSLVAYYLLWHYGTMIPESWLLLSLTIVIGGILLGSVFSVILVLIHGLVLITVTLLQINGVIHYVSWDETPMIGSALVATLSFVTMAVISCLSNREIEKALQKAKKSELELKKERDHLELEVEKRVKELKKIQLERIINLYKFADFGRLTVGLFHDIANPLTQVSLSLSKIEYQAKNELSTELNKIEPAIKRAIRGTKQMERLIVSVRKQVQQQESKLVYKPWIEMEAVVENFEYKAKEVRVQLNLVGKKEVKTFGNSIRFYQLASNLVSNALDSYYEIKRKENRKVIVKLDTDKKNLILTVEDFGCGINKEITEKIFDPLFTTKDFKRGSGVGLYISKNIVEKEFEGKIEVKSKINEGSVFTVTFPIKNKPDGK